MGGGGAGTDARQHNSYEFPVIMTHVDFPHIETKSARRKPASAPIDCHLTAVPGLFGGRQCEYRQRPTERGIGRQTGIATDRAETGGIDRLLLRRQLALIDRAMPGGGVFRLQQTAARPMPAQPPTPDSTPIYCL